MPGVRPLVGWSRHQPDPGAVVAPYVVSPAAAPLIPAAPRFPPATGKNQIRVCYLQREPFLRQRVRHVPRCQRVVFRWACPARHSPHPGLHPELHRCRRQTGHRHPSHRAGAKMPRLSTAWIVAIPAWPRRSTCSMALPPWTVFAADEYSRFASKGRAANVAMGTAGDELYRLRHDPVLLACANRFALFDNILRPRTPRPAPTRSQ